MLAQILFWFLTCLLVFVFAWGSMFWRNSPLLAFSGLALISLLYFLLLAIQFLVMAVANKHDLIVPASLNQLVRAWLQETFVAARVFFWWQPFRFATWPDEIPDHHSHPPRRGIVFIHGFVCNRGLWNPWFCVLHDRRIPFIAVNLEPVFGSIDAYTSAVDAAVQQMKKATGLPPLLICHSMGGLVARAWLRYRCDDNLFHYVVTLGSPHHGTGLGGGGPVPRWMINAHQMRPHSQWLTELAQGEPLERRQRFTCFYSNCDNVVIPASSATLPGADNRMMPGVPHLALAVDRTVMIQALALL